MCMYTTICPSIHPLKIMSSYWYHHFQSSTTELFLAFILSLFVTHSPSVKSLTSSVLNIPTYLLNPKNFFRIFLPILL